MINMDVLKRFRFTIVAVVAAVVGLLIYQFGYNRTPPGCAPVLDLLEFNRQQAALIAEKTKDQQGAAPSQTEQLAYEQWADGLSERAGKVTDSALAAQSVELALSAGDFVNMLPQVRAATETRVPGAPAPVVVYQMSALSDRIDAQLAGLTKACKR